MTENTQAVRSQPISPMEIAAAGLLHDLGKILQPAGETLSTTILELERFVCPVRDGRYSHRHVLFTAQSLHQASSNLGRMDRSRIERVANYHHRPSTDQLDENLLTKADWLASGHDRAAASSEEERTGLIPITSTLSWPENALMIGDMGSRAVPVGPLSFAIEDYLPGPRLDMNMYRNRCLILAKALADGLNQDFKNPEECLDGLIGLTQRLSHAVPASRYRGHVPDVSLFDHSRMVAAIAACLSVLNHGDARSPNEIRGRYRFVSLGLGGIQKFIFHSIPVLEPNDSEENLTDTKGAAKRLRARSFYLSLSSWVAARRVLRELAMPMTNLIYDAGGHSLLLIPDEPELVERAAVDLATMASNIHQALGGTIRFDYAISEPLGDHHFHRNQFQRVLREIELARANSRVRFPDATMLEHTGWSKNTWVREQRESLPVDRTAFREAMGDLGNALPKAKYLAIESGDRGLWRGEILGAHISLHETKPSSGHRFALELDPYSPHEPLFLSGSHLPVATQEDIARLTRSQDVSEVDFDAVTEVGDTLTFNDLARLSVDDRGTPIEHAMLGALKADVDLLGTLISYGFSGTNPSEEHDEFKGNRATLGRLAGLSRSLDQFFKGFVVQQVRSSYPHLYTVFVGGDDLFLIGPWYDLARFVGQLRAWFRRFSCENPNITFSAGLIFSKPTTPIRHLAEQAERSLDMAKDAGRNRINYGQVTLTWDQYEHAFELHQLLHRCAQLDGSVSINPSLVYRLLSYARDALECHQQVMSSVPQRKLRLAAMKWRAQMSYDLKRNLPLKPEGAPQELIELHQKLMTIQTMSDACILYTAASLTLYRIRGDQS
jgi:CRISPR-associated protein Csm1